MDVSAVGGRCIRQNFNVRMTGIEQGGLRQQQRIEGQERSTSANIPHTKAGASLKFGGLGDKPAEA